MPSRLAPVFARACAPSRRRLLHSRQHNRQLSDLLHKLTHKLGLDQARVELRWLQQYLGDRSTPHLNATNDNVLFTPTCRNQPLLDPVLLPDKYLSHLSDLVDRRLRGEPLQYILGTQPFGPLSLLVRPPTLIPRPETEEWTLRLASLLQATTQGPSPKFTSSNSIKLLDLCTGSGCIPLLLCHLLPPGHIRAIGVDVSSQAVNLAHENSLRVAVQTPPLIGNNNSNINNINNNDLGVNDFPNSDLPITSNTFQPVQENILAPGFNKRITAHDGPFDVITSNPPYIPQDEYDKLPTSVRDYEDHRALLGNPIAPDSDSLYAIPPYYRQRGLVFYVAIAKLLRIDHTNDNAHSLLKPGGIVVLEVGHDQAEEVQKILREYAGIQHTEVWKDFSGIDRVILGRT